MRNVGGSTGCKEGVSGGEKGDWVEGGCSTISVVRLKNKASDNTEESKRNNRTGREGRVRK